MRKFRDLDEIKAANKAAGHHWFNPSTLRFFSSRVNATLYQGRFFITSERPHHDERRLYTVRAAHEDGSIGTVGPFYHYSRNEALRAARRVAKYAEDKCPCDKCDNVDPFDGLGY